MKKENIQSGLYAPLLPKRYFACTFHLSVKEPDIANEYYTDEINFDDDKLLIPHFKNIHRKNRGGSGVVRILLKDNMQIAEHNIVLGLNIPNYPKKATAVLQSGLNIGKISPHLYHFMHLGRTEVLKLALFANMAVIMALFISKWEIIQIGMK